MEVLKIKDWIKTRRKKIAIAENINTENCVIDYFYLPIGINTIGELFNSQGFKDFREKQYRDFHEKNTASKLIPGHFFSSELGIILSPPMYGGKCAPPVSIFDYLKTVQ